MSEFQKVNYTFLGLGLFAIFLLFKAEERIEWSARGFWMIAFVAIWALTETADWVSRYHQPKVILDDITGSFDGRLHPVGDWYVCSTGYSLLPYPKDPKFCTYVFPRQGTQKVGRNVKNKCQMFNTHVNQLPVKVSDFLKAHPKEFNLQEIKWGFATRVYMEQNPDKVDDIVKFKDLNRQIGEARDIIDGKRDMVEREVKSSKELVGDQSKIKEFLERFRRKEEEE